MSTPTHTQRMALKRLHDMDRAVACAPKLAEALRKLEFYSNQVPFMDRTRGLIDSMNEARALLAEWDAK